MSFSIVYTVTAGTEFQAIANAVALLRTGVKLRAVNSAHRVTGTLWRVSLNCFEDL